MIKKLCAILLALVMVLSLAACDLNEALSQAEKLVNDLESLSTGLGDLEDLDIGGLVGDETVIEELWKQIEGCWICGTDRFVLFSFDENGEPTYLAGGWDSPIPWNRGEASVKFVGDLGGWRYTVTLVYPPNEENAADEQDLQPLEYSIIISTDELRKQILHMSVPEGDPNGVQYDYAGASYEEAYEKVHGGESTFTDLYEIWHELIGYWITDDQTFAVLDMADSHTAVFYYGWWETEFQSDEAIVTELTASGNKEMTATLTDGGVIIIDYAAWETDGTVRIKIAEQEWRQFTNGGGTLQEAYQAFCDSREGT